MDNQVKRNIGIWGPIAIDQFVIGSDENAPITLEPKWGGCGLNQATAINKLSQAFQDPRGAYLLSSVGPDFYETLAQFQGYAQMGLPELPNIEPMLHHSAIKTTSWKVSLVAPHDGRNEETKRRIDELSRRLEGNPRALRALEAQLNLFEQFYQAEGTSIRDLERPSNVESLLKLLDEKGFPMIMSVVGGTPKMEGGVINAIREHKKNPRPLIYYDPGPAFSSDPKLVLGQLSKVDIFRTNRYERYLFADKDSGIQFKLSQHPNLSVITTKATEISTYLWDRGRIVRVDTNGLPVIKADTTGAGDVFGASFIWYLDGKKDRVPRTIIEAVEFGMASAFVYMQCKRKERAAGVSRYNITRNEIDYVRKQIRSQENQYKI